MRTRRRLEWHVNKDASRECRSAATGDAGWRRARRNNGSTCHVGTPARAACCASTRCLRSRRRHLALVPRSLLSGNSEAGRGGIPPRRLASSSPLAYDGPQRTPRALGANAMPRVCHVTLRRDAATRRALCHAIRSRRWTGSWRQPRSQGDRKHCLTARLPPCVDLLVCRPVFPEKEPSVCRRETRRARMRRGYDVNSRARVGAICNF